MDLPDDIALRLLVRDAEATLPLAALSAEERDQLRSFGSETRRRSFALGRMAVRALLAERLALAEPAVPLLVADDGALEVREGGLRVSLSHVATRRQTLAVAVAAPHAVGVDLEVVQPRRPDLYRFLLAPDDYGILDTLPFDHHEAQVLIWTLKEAVLKALRTGFRLSPKKLRLSVGPEPGVASVTVEDVRWALRYERQFGCFLAVALPLHDQRRGA